MTAQQLPAGTPFAPSLADPRAFRSLIQPPSVLLMGAPGSGKTTSLATFLDAGIEVFVIGTEPNASDSLIDAARASGRDLSKIHYHFVAPAPSNWTEMIDVAKQVQAKSYEDLSKIKDGIGKSKLEHWLDLLNTCANFRDDFTDKSYGDVTEWDDDRVLVIDSLTGLNEMARQYTVGLKPSMAQGEWGVAMELEGGLLRKLVSDRKCFFVLTAHLDRNIDEATQATKLMPMALGNKLAPKLTPLFSEVVLAKKVTPPVGGGPTKFVWATADGMADLKNRALALDTALPPSFVPLVEAHRRRKGGS